MIEISSAAILFPAAILFRGQLCRKHLAGHFDTNIVKISQVVQKIWHEEVKLAAI